MVRDTNRVRCWLRPVSCVIDHFEPFARGDLHRRMEFTLFDFLAFIGASYHSLVSLLLAYSLSQHLAERQAHAMQASVCALVMLSACGKYDVGRGEEAVPLRLHCGMGR